MRRHPGVFAGPYHRPVLWLGRCGCASDDLVHSGEGEGVCAGPGCFAYTGLTVSYPPGPPAGAATTGLMRNIWGNRTGTIRPPRSRAVLWPVLQTAGA